MLRGIGKRSQVGRFQLMKRSCVAVFLVFLIAQLSYGGSIDVCFSPGGTCEERICSEIRSARRSIDVMMYYFTSGGICDALMDAGERDIKVRIILDRSQKDLKYSRWRALHSLNILVHFYEGKGLLHHKVAVIDGEKVLTGSYNWTEAAEKKNEENLIIIRDERIARAFQAEFEKLFKETEVSEGGRGLSEIEGRAPPASAAVLFIASKNSEVFHHSGCPFARRIKKENRIFFGTLPEVLKSGRRACKKCAK